MNTMAKILFLILTLMCVSIYVRANLARADVTRQVTENTQTSIVGHARVLDGDTIEVRRTRVRFAHIDALELDQTCNSWAGGREAAEMLGHMISKQPVTCMVTGTDVYGRQLGVCVNYKGENLNELMLKHGYAVAYKGSPSNYYYEHWKAFNNEVGMWASSRACALPSEHRRAKKK